MDCLQRAAKVDKGDGWAVDIKGKIASRQIVWQAEYV